MFGRSMGTSIGGLRKRRAGAYGVEVRNIFQPQGDEVSVEIRLIAISRKTKTIHNSIFMSALIRASHNIDAEVCCNGGLGE